MVWSGLRMRRVSLSRMANACAGKNSCEGKGGCVQCAKGRYQPSANKTKCLGCGAGRYGTQVEQVSCKQPLLGKN